MASINVPFSLTIGPSYQWTESGSGTDEWYLELSGGGDPGLSTTDFSATYEGSALTEGTIGSLAAGEYALGDNDTLGFTTLYVRIPVGVATITGVTTSGMSGSDYNSSAWAQVGQNATLDVVNNTCTVGGSYRMYAHDFFGILYYLIVFDTDSNEWKCVTSSVDPETWTTGPHGASSVESLATASDTYDSEFVPDEDDANISYTTSGGSAEPAEDSVEINWTVATLFPITTSPLHWLANQHLKNEGTGSMSGWANWGTDGDTWTGSGTNSIASEGHYYNSSQFTSPNTASNGAFTLVQFLREGSTGTWDHLFELQDSFTIDINSAVPAVAFYGEDGNDETFTGSTNIGGYGGDPNMMIVTYQPGSGGSGATIRMRINGAWESFGGSTTITTTDDDFDTPTTGWQTEINSYARMGLMIFDGVLSDSDIESIEGWASHASPFAEDNSEWNSLLPSGHPYETNFLAAPTINTHTTTATKYAGERITRLEAKNTES